MFKLINKKTYDLLCLENNHNKLTIDVLTEDNQNLRNVNDFYIRRYNDAKNIIRILNNKIPGNTQIPEKCAICDNILFYNENLHVATCVNCSIIIK